MVADTEKADIAGRTSQGLCHLAARHQITASQRADVYQGQTLHGRY